MINRKLIDMTKYNNKVVAIDKDNKTKYIVRVFKDGSSAIMYTKNDDNCHIWCGCLKLKEHIAHLNYITRKNYLDEWKIVNNSFFKDLGII